MKGERWLSVLVAILGLTLAGRASAAEGAPPIEDKKWALQFGVIQDFQLGSFENGEVSLKQRLSDVSALRYGLGLSFDWTNENGKDSNLASRLSVFYQRYVNPKSAAAFYWGVGPGFSYAYTYRLMSDSNNFLERTFKDYGVALLGMVGVEWFATRVISFHAEYRADATYHFLKEADKAKLGSGALNRNEFRSSAFDIRNSGVLFGMSVYF